MGRRKEQKEFEDYNDMYLQLTSEEHETFGEIRLLNNEEMEQEYQYQIQQESSYKGDKYLSDVLDIDDIIQKYGNKILIVAGVGAGKSTWVKNVLAKKPAAEGNVLFITSRRAKVNQDIKGSLFDDRLRMDEKRPVWRTLVTNSKLAYFMMDLCLNKKDNDHALLNQFLDRYKYIVIDEVHSLATDSVFAHSSFNILSFIEYAVGLGKNVIAMTGTPQPIMNYFIKHKWFKLDLTKQCKYVKPLKINKVMEDGVDRQIKAELSAGRKVVYFVNSVNQIQGFCERLTKKTGESIVEPQNMAIIVAQNRKEELDDQLKEILSDRYKEVIDTSVKTYSSIIDQQRIPDFCKILISTSTLREGIDILNDNVTVICENHILSNIIQFAGRTRLGNSVFYIVSDKAQHRVILDEILYNYACQDELNAANHFYETNMTGEVSADLKKQLIEHVERNKYIRFNYIQQKFMIDQIRYEEEKRIIASQAAWESDLKEYCDYYGIINFYMSAAEKKKLILESLEILFNHGRKLFDQDERNNLCQILYSMLGFDQIYKQPKTINQRLIEYGYQISSIRGTKGEERNKTYWTIQKIEMSNHTNSAKKSSKPNRE